MKYFFAVFFAVFCFADVVIAGNFYVPEGTPLRQAVDDALLHCQGDKARVRDASTGVVYRLALSRPSGNCRTGLLIAASGDTAQVSICKPSAQRSYDYTSEQQMLNHGYAVSMQQNPDVGAQYALRGHENAPYQARTRTQVNLNNLHNMPYDKAKEYMAIEKLIREDEMATVRVNRAAASAATAWTSGAYNRGYSQESYPGQHTTRQVNDWINIINRIANINW